MKNDHTLITAFTRFSLVLVSVTRVYLSSLLNHDKVFGLWSNFDRLTLFSSKVHVAYSEMCQLIEITNYHIIKIITIVYSKMILNVLI